jgi:[acyl-carrier-protein] S-malonyltransferase
VPATTALLFPGQGAQAVGMGVDWAERHPAARRVFETASAVLGYDLLALCRDGPESALVRTDVQQPAILAAGAAAVEALRAGGALREEDVGFSFGLSLGEFTALWAAGSLALEDALVLVRERGIGMQEASAARPSGMTALRCEPDLAEEACAAARARTGGVCVVANRNAPGQAVLSGDLVTLEVAEAEAAARGVRRPTRLDVAGAFHSPLMEPGARRLEAALSRVAVRAPRLRVYSNVTGRSVSGPDEVRRNLVAQVTSPVLFLECVRSARADGMARAVEAPPGTVLSGLLRRIDPAVEVVSAAGADALPAVAGGRRP